MALAASAADFFGFLIRFAVCTVRASPIRGK
jgi:hypothetical protein